MDCSSSVAVLFTACLILAGVVHSNSSDDENGCAKKFQIFKDHTACAHPSKNALRLDLKPQEKKEIVDQHNQLRAGVQPPATNMLKMSWDDELAMIAQKRTDTCPFVNGHWKHDTGYQRFVPGRFSVGQNLAVGQQDFKSCIIGWYREADDYVYGKQTTSNVHVGHYTQLVWAKSVKIGCGRTRCSGGPIVYVCNYAPAGNVAGFTRPYESGSIRGADCKTNDDGLCDCGDLVCENGRPLNTSKCSCDCGERFNEPECSLNCDIADTWYCGKGDFTKPNCYGGFAPFVTSDCPKQCGICPYKERVDPVKKSPIQPGRQISTRKNHGMSNVFLVSVGVDTSGTLFYRI